MTNEYPADLAPIFEAIADRAARLCESEDVRVFVVEGNFLRYVAGFGDIQYPLDPLRPLTRGLATGRAVIDRAVVHVDDFATVPETEFPEGRANQRRYGYHTTLAVPLILGDKALGAILLRRREVRPFDAKHIELVKAFADQAAVAIENLRLSTELKARNAELTEALEQQTATAEILKVISSSPTDIQPVLDAVVCTAARLCGASDVIMRLVDGDVLRLAAHFGPVPIVREAVPISHGTYGGRAVLERRTIHVHDVTDERARAEYPGSPLGLRGAPYRTVLAAPLLREDAAIGTITMRRPESGPFSDQQVKLLETFAAQAVIAIENVRLFNETKEALEQQTATAEILKVISSSPTDIQPVLDAVAESAARLCGATDVIIRRVDGERLSLAAHFGAVPTFQPGTRIGRGWVAGRAVLECRTIHVHNVLDPSALEEYPDAASSRIPNAPYRTLLAVPMVRKDAAIGVIIIRRPEVRPFSDREIKLLETFAAQAVIAIENVRLFNETKEALEQQTATAEILKVISSSPTDVQPVFEAIVHSGVRLFRGLDVALRLVRGDHTEMVACTMPALGPDIPLGNGEQISSRAILRREVLQFADVFAADGITESTRQRARDRGFRAIMFAPMLKEGSAIGEISVSRAAPGPFTEKEVALLQTFADQAVIAIENVRLFNETKEALEQQTATAEILKVISSSPTDTQPVFDAIAQSGGQLFRGMNVALRVVKGEYAVRVASTSKVNDPGSDLYPANDESLPGVRAILRREVVQVPDIAAEDWVSPRVKETAQRRGWRAILAAPMLREKEAIGEIAVTRATPGPFSDREIALLKTFADQAVIAIQNVRLFKELQAKNADLAESLDRQTATTEILRVISNSPTDIQPVLDAVAESAARLCNADDVVIRRIDGDTTWIAAHIGSIPVQPDAGVTSLSLRTMMGTVARERRTLHIPDVTEPHVREKYPDSRFAGRGMWGIRTTLIVPLLREDVVIGSIAMRRREVRPFSEKQIELLETFAAQAVIAIENVRLFKELQARNAEITESLEQQTATAEILKVISSSPTDVQPVFDAIVRSGIHLFGGLNMTLRLVKGDRVETVASSLTGWDEKDIFSTPLNDEGFVSTRSILRRDIVHVSDIRVAEWAHEKMKARGEQFGWRAVLCAPMLRENKAIGAITVTRTATGLFNDKQVALLKTFADQAVIAIENVRLFKELQARNAEITESLEQQTATAEILRVISSSPTEIQPVFDAILENATRLCDGHLGLLGLWDGETFHSVAQRGANAEFAKWLADRGPFKPGSSGGVLTRMIAERRPIQIPDNRESPAYRDRKPYTVAFVEIGGARTYLAVPMLKEGRVVGAISIYRPEVRRFTQKQIDLVSTFANQAVIAIENVRLFREIQEKGRQLETANKHKSEFLANMSHELRTPLNAVIGFSEALLEKMFGELNAKQEDYLKDIHSSGRHLLSLINDILDLSKVEAGRMELELSEFHLPAALKNAMTLVRDRAQTHGIGLKLHVDPKLGDIRADERKFKQILLNLLSNAVKFTPDGGRVDVDARMNGDSVKVSVKDTGIGIAAKDQAALFEEFRQVGRDFTTKREGTGLGLALTRRFVELHGGTVSLKSELGKGSTFTFTLPLNTVTSDRKPVTSPRRREAMDEKRKTRT